MSLSVERCINNLFSLEFNFFPVTDLAILLDFIMIGLPNRFYACKFIIVKSEPGSSWNLILLFNIF